MTLDEEYAIFELVYDLSYYWKIVTLYDSENK
jgi:hypothetical protein